MRELTRSMMRVTWAMPLLGLSQMAKLVAPADRSRPLDSATETFESLADVAYRHLGPRFRDVYEQGDRLQEQVVDTFFGLIPGTAGESECNPSDGDDSAETKSAPSSEPAQQATQRAEAERGASTSTKRSARSRKTTG